MSRTQSRRRPFSGFERELEKNIDGQPGYIIAARTAWPCSAHSSDSSTPRNSRGLMLMAEGCIHINSNESNELAIGFFRLFFVAVVL